MPAKRQRGRPPKKTKENAQQTAKARGFKAIAPVIAGVDGECGICYEALWATEGSSVGRLLKAEQGPPWQFACSHAFCGSCLGKHVQRSRTCPFCREPGVGWHSVSKADGGTTTGSILSALDEAERQQTRLLQAGSGDDDSYGVSAAAVVNDSITDLDMERRVLRRCRGVLRARQTKMSNKTVSECRQVEAEQAEVCDVANAQAALRAGDTAKRVAEVLVALGCVSNGRHNERGVDCRGLPDVEVFEYIHEAGVLVAPAVSRARSAIGKVIRCDPHVVSCVREVLGSR